MVNLIDLTTLRGAIESLLFVADTPISVDKFGELLGQDKNLITKVIKDLQQEYQENERGFQVREVGGGYRFMTHPGYAEYVEKLVISKDYRRLTQAALETLAIIAYKQPITRQEISNIRGVNAEAVIHSLEEKSLIEEKGRQQGPGLPIIYGTTQEFLESFGLKSLDDLPPLEEFEPEEATKQQIKLKLKDFNSELEEETEEVIEEGYIEDIESSKETEGENLPDNL